MDSRICFRKLIKKNGISVFEDAQTKTLWSCENVDAEGQTFSIKLKRSSFTFMPKVYK